MVFPTREYGSARQKRHETQEIVFQSDMHLRFNAMMGEQYTGEVTQLLHAAAGGDGAANRRIYAARRTITDSDRLRTFKSCRRVKLIAWW